MRWPRWLPWLCYGTASAVLLTSMHQAALRFPGGYDWRYEVLSALASRKHNPEGAAWFSAGLIVSMILMAFVAQAISGVTRGSPEGLGATAAWALRVGLLAGALVGLDRLAFHHLSDMVRKGHEILALLAFAGWFTGIVAMYLVLMKRRAVSRVPVVLVLLPLVAVVLREFILYLGQRTVGWSDHDWKGAGISLWLSFAFWQWLTAAALWLAMAHLLWIAHRSESAATVVGRKTERH